MQSIRRNSNTQILIIIMRVCVTLIMCKAIAKEPSPTDSLKSVQYKKLNGKSKKTDLIHLFKNVKCDAIKCEAIGTFADVLPVKFNAEFFTLKEQFQNFQLLLPNTTLKNWVPTYK